MTIKAVVFDMDGLLLDTETFYKMAWQQAASDLGFELNDDAYATLVGRPNDACEGELRRRFGAEFPMPSFRARWSDLWREAVETRGIPAKPGLEALLAFVEARGISRAIATSSDAHYTELSLRKAGLAGRFEVIVTGDQIARGKPAPDIYLEAARRVGTRAGRVPGVRGFRRRCPRRHVGRHDDNLRARHQGTVRRDRPRGVSRRPVARGGHRRDGVSHRAAVESLE